MHVYEAIFKEEIMDLRWSGGDKEELDGLEMVKIGYSYMKLFKI